MHVITSLVIMSHVIMAHVSMPHIIMSRVIWLVHKLAQLHAACCDTFHHTLSINTGVTSSMQSVNGQKIGFVRIKQFSTTTADDVAAALSSLSGAKAFVLDLRGNTGGYFPGGVVSRLHFQVYRPLPSHGRWPAPHTARSLLPLAGRGASLPQS